MMFRFIKKFIPICLLFTMLFVAEPVYAQANNVADAQRALANLQQILGVILSMLSILIWPVLSMIGALMSNDLIFGPQVEDRLFLIWGQIRNFINLAYVLVLIGIALYNIVGIGEESNYTLKKILPRFIISLIVVNFTFFGAKVILSSANVLTTAVFALPNSVETSLTSLDANVLAQRMCPTVVELYPENGFCLDQATFTPEAVSYFQSYSGDNIAFIMALNYAQIGEILKVSELVQQVPTIQSITVNLLISLLMYFIYTVAFVVMFIVLVVRVVVLWFLIAFSPILALQIVFPDGLKSITGEFDIQSMFIKHAFAPVIIGVGMTIGHMLLDAYSQNSAVSLGSSLVLGEDFGNAFSAGSGGIQQVLIGIAAAAVIWKVSFAAAEGTLAKGITDSIKSSISNTATRVAKLPTYLPIIPVPKSLNESGSAALASFPAQFDRRLEQIRSEGINSLGGQDRNVRDIGSLKGYINSNRSDARLNEGVIRTLERDRDVQSELTVGRLKQIIDQEVRDGRITGDQQRRIVTSLGNDDTVKISNLPTSNRRTVFEGLRTHQSIQGNTDALVDTRTLAREDRGEITSPVINSTANNAAAATQLTTTLTGFTAVDQSNRSQIETALREARSTVSSLTDGSSERTALQREIDRVSQLMRRAEADSNQRLNNPPTE